MRSIVHFEVPDSGNPMHIGEAERRVSLLNEVVYAIGILLDMAFRLEQNGQFHFFGVAQSHFEPVDVDAYLFVEVTIVDR